jgi:undecaprenyl-diphosphatase
MPPRPASARPVLEAALLGLLHGPVEVLPVSSSAHVAALPWLLGWEVAGWEEGPRKELAVALHAGTALGLLLARPALPALRRPVLLAALAPPAAAGALLEGPIERRLDGPAALAAGLVLGAAALAAADRAPAARAAADAGLLDGALLGLAQAAALIPGVSRQGATLAAARARGFSRPAAAGLSWRAGLPVLLGATAWKGRALRDPGAWRARRAPLAAGLLASLASSAVVARRPGLVRRRPLWPWAAWRAGLAAAILAVWQHRGR